MDSTEKRDRGQMYMLLRKQQIPSVMIGDENVSGATSKSVLRSIHDHGVECWAGADTIGLEACLSEKTVRKAFKALVKVRLLDVEPRSGKSSVKRIRWQNFDSTPEATSDVESDSTPEAAFVTPEATSDDIKRNIKETKKKLTDVESSETFFLEQKLSTDKPSKPDKLAGFEAWYAIYPKKVARGSAEKAYTKAITDIRRSNGLNDGQAVVELQKLTLDRLPSLESAEEKYRPYPATWLNEKRYRDEIETKQTPADALADYEDFQ